MTTKRRCSRAVALVAASGFLAANTLLASQDIQPEPIDSVPRRGLLGR